MWHTRKPNLGSWPQASPNLLPANGTKAEERYDQRVDRQGWIAPTGRAEYADTVREPGRFLPKRNAPIAEKAGLQKRA